MSQSPLARLQKRTFADTALILPGMRNVKDLTRKLRSRLSKAFIDGVLSSDYGHLVTQKERVIEIPGLGQQQAIAVWGGVEINFKRDPEKPHFKRSDDAWFDFHILLREYKKSLELLAYGYEIRFPSEIGCDIRWLRFDLNPPGHHNDLRSIRAHFHPGDEDLQAPSPVLHPEEALELLLSDLLQLPNKRRVA